MKLIILSERVSHRPTCIVSGQSGKPYVFCRDTASRFYCYQTVSDSPSGLQDELNDIIASPDADISIAIDETTFFQVQGEQRRPVSEFAPPAYESLEHDDLVAMCESLEIPFDKRVSTESLRDRLATYYKGQTDLYQQFDLPSLETVEPKAPVDEPTAFDRMCEEAEGVSAEKIVASFQNKQQIVDWVKETSGVELDISLKRTELEKQALAATNPASSGGVGE